MSNPINSATVGIAKLVYAIMSDSVTESYGTVKSAPPLINLKASPSADDAKLYADNELVESSSSVTEVAIELETQDLPLEVQADLLGHSLNKTTGEIIYSSTDAAPFVAIGYEREKNNGSKRYVWFPKVKFQEPDEEGATKEDKTVFQTPKISGTAYKNKDGNWKYTADEDVKGSAITGYLDSVPSSVPSV